MKPPQAFYGPWRQQGSVRASVTLCPQQVQRDKANCRRWTELAVLRRSDGDACEQSETRRRIGRKTPAALGHAEKTA